MNRLLLTNELLNNVISNWDRAFFNEDYSYWRRGDSITCKKLEDGYEYYVPLPGFKKKDVKANVSDRIISLDVKNDENTASYSFAVPDDADVLTASSKMVDGLLTINIEKIKEAKPIELKIS